ncbi:MAG TPA: hypothetical protein VF432_20835 [Thermoanaerobaculia bacterium]
MKTAALIPTFLASLAVSAQEPTTGVLPNTTHVTLMDKLEAIVPMVDDFLNAPPALRVPARKPGGGTE